MFCQLCREKDGGSGFRVGCFWCREPGLCAKTHDAQTHDAQTYDAQTSSARAFITPKMEQGDIEYIRLQSRSFLHHHRLEPQQKDPELLS